MHADGTTLPMRPNVGVDAMPGGTLAATVGATSYSVAGTIGAPSDKRTISKAFEESPMGSSSPLSAAATGTADPGANLDLTNVPPASVLGAVDLDGRLLKCVRKLLIAGATALEAVLE